MYTPLNTLLNPQEHDKKRVYNSQNDMRGLLINHYASQMDQRYGTSSSADSERIAQMANEQRMSRIQTPMEQRPVLDQRRDIYEQQRTDHLKQASQMEQERTEHMKRLLEKQEQERIDRSRLHTYT